MAKATEQKSTFAGALMFHSGELVLDRYRVHQILGKGGFGLTFQVDDGGTLKVLKVLKLDRFQSPEGKHKAVALFQREAIVLCRLKHPGIPRVESDGYFTLPDETGNQLHCLVMEKIEGLNLKQWQYKRKKQPITQELAIAWLKQLIEILEQVHQQGLVHRDIKPSNIMIRPNGQLVLIDFGAVREITETYLHKQEQNATGTVIISAGYTPPEQVEGHAVTQSDFFALGRTFVHLVTGKHPSDFDKDSRTGKLLWRDSAPQISKELADVIDYMMAAFPGKRPQNPQMIRRCLEEIISPVPPLPPPPPLLEEPSRTVRNRKAVAAGGDSITSSESGTSKPKGLFSLISSFLPTTTTPSIWAKARLRRTLSGHSDVVKAIAVSPNGQILASGSYDKTVKVWSLATGEVRHTFTEHQHRVSCVAISPDSQILASGSYDKTIKLWLLTTGEELHTLRGRPDRVRYLTFSPNGQMLISSGDWEIKIWAVRTGKLLHILAGNSNSARIVEFSPDGHTCAVASLDGTLELWNPHNGKQLRTFSDNLRAIGSIAFSGDGQVLACGSSRAIHLWNPHTGKLLRSFSPQFPGVASLAFSRDGQTLACASDKTIELWDWNSGKRMCILSGHFRNVESVAFSPGGRILVSGSSDQTIKIWQPM
jgi:serine/threonine protein kinase